jgi:hypothetical protein
MTVQAGCTPRKQDRLNMNTRHDTNAKRARAGPASSFGRPGFYFSNGLPRSWKWTTFGVCPLPPSICALELPA